MGSWVDDDEYEEDGGEEGSKEEGTRLVKALKGRGNGVEFSEKEVRRALRGLSREARMRLIAIILDCAFSSFLSFLFSLSKDDVISQHVSPATSTSKSSSSPNTPN